jgi:predicted permease
MAMVGLVLVLACVNIAGLLIGRGIQRQSEFAVRMAVGAGRTRLVSQLFTESLLLVALGALVGILSVPWTTRLLTQFAPSQRDASAFPTAMDIRVLGFSLGVSAIAVLIFGLVPAFMSTHLNLVTTLREHASNNAKRGRLRSVLVCVQIGLSLVLLMGAALFTRSLHNLYALDPGFNTSTVVAFGVDPVLNGYPRAQSEDTYRRLKERLEAIPGVESAGFGLVRVLARDVWDSAIVVEGYQPKPGRNAYAYMNVVSSDYFQTLGIPLMAGRDFRDSDRMDTAHVAIVNETFAKRYFDGNSAMGRRVGLNGPNSAMDTEIIGIVRDAKYNGVREDTPPQAFIPYPQLFTVMGMNGYVRSKTSPEGIFSIIRQAVREVDPALPIHEMRTLDTQRDRSLATERLLTFLTSAFGILATGLAAIGLYGILNYSVTRRMRELGLRMALGAQGRSILWIVLKEVVWLCSLGIAIALPTILALGHLVASQLYGVTSSDLKALGTTTLILIVVAVLAAASPAYRAVKIDPMEALRYE